MNDILVRSFFYNQICGLIMTSFLRKAMGKTTRLYLSMSEAFIPNNRSGGGPTGAGAVWAGEQPKNNKN